MTDERRLFAEIRYAVFLYQQMQPVGSVRYVRYDRGKYFLLLSYLCLIQFRAQRG